MDEKAPKIDDKKFAAHMNKNKKPKTMTPGQKSFADIRKRADSMAQNPKIVRSRKSSPSLRRKLINATEQDMSGMCCKNCGDMYGKPTKENRSCMYNAYDPKGKNWINAEKYHEAMVNPQSNLTKKQRQALASPAAKAKPPSQVSVKKAPFPIPDKKDVRREEVELDEAKLNIKKIHKAVDDGKSMDVIVGMFANRRTTNTDEIRKIVKDYKFKKRMREAVITPKMQKRALASPAAKAKPKSQVTLPKMPKLSIDKQKDEGNGLWANIRAKRARGERMRKKGEKGAPTQDQIRRAQGEAVSPAQQAAIAISKKERGEKPKDEGAMSRIASTGSTLKKPKGLDTFKKKPTNESFDFKVNIDGFPEMFMSGNSPSEVKTHLRKLVKQPSMIQSVDRVTKADKKKHHRDKVKESYAPDEGTPEATQKAKSMTPGQEGVMDFLKNVGNTVMYGTQKSSKPARKPRVNTNRGSTSGRTNSIASRINFGGKYGNK